MGWHAYKNAMKLLRLHNKTVEAINKHRKKFFVAIKKVRTLFWYHSQ